MKSSENSSNLFTSLNLEEQTVVVCLLLEFGVLKKEKRNYDWFFVFDLCFGDLNCRVLPCSCNLAKPIDQFTIDSCLSLFFANSRGRKTLFVTACPWWNNRTSLRELDQKFLVIGNSFLNFVFFCLGVERLLPKPHNVLWAVKLYLQKNLATITWLGEIKIHVCLVTWLE